MHYSLGCMLWLLKLDFFGLFHNVQMTHPSTIFLILMQTIDTYPQVEITEHFTSTGPTNILKQ